MRIVQFNATCGIGSTGKIAVGVSRLLSVDGIENYIIYSNRSNGYELGIPCAEGKYIRFQALKSRLFGNYGFNSKKATKRIIKELERIQPDVVHLHNIHGHDCDLEMLFTYFKKSKTKLVWTFHDCWAFTGYCTHFTMAKCDKWKSECRDCVQYREFSWLFDKSSSLYNRKKKLFEGLDLTVVTPSVWLANLVRQSFLKEYPIEVINNGIDLDIFKPTQSDFRQKHSLEGKKLLLGVSFDWGERKGLDVFIELAKRLPDDYRIALVGTNDKVDTQLPDNIISIHRTQNQNELAEIYTAADLFVNVTREDTYPTVNMEAIACGTPVLTFKTGGSPEMLDESCGSAVECNDVDTLEKEVIRICSDKPYAGEQCVVKAKEFDKNERFKEYAELYERINTAGNEGN